jgi:hypothetical protein
MREVLTSMVDGIVGLRLFKVLAVQGKMGDMLVKGYAVSLKSDMLLTQLVQSSVPFINSGPFDLWPLAPKGLCFCCFCRNGCVIT